MVLLGEEDRDPYEKPPLSKEVLSGAVEPDTKPIVDPAALTAAGVEFLRAASVVAVDRQRRVVRLKTGALLSYDALILATGARARGLASLPLGMPRVHYLRTAADALVLRSSLQRHGRRPRVVVVGAGLIGLEAAASAAGPSTIVLEAGPAAMSRVCSPEFAGMVVDRHARGGVQFRFGVTVASARSCENGMVVGLSDGTTIESDVVIVGIGAQANTDLAVAAGLPVADGIVVDDRCRTADPSILAAGDVAQFKTRWCNAPMRLENWRHALDQGQVAGINAAGGDAAYDNVPSFWSDQYDLKIQGVGWTDGLASAPLRRVVNDSSLIEFHVRDGRIRYAIGVGMSREINIVRRLIEREVPVTPQMLSDGSVSLQRLLRS